MTAKQLRFLGGTAVMASCLLWGWRGACAEPVDERIVRLAELEINPAQLNDYKVALREEIETSIRVEPGVLTLYAVSVKGHPDQIRLFETYRNAAAYQAHLESAHFKRYKARTQGMVKSLTLVEMEPILLDVKSR